MKTDTNPFAGVADALDGCVRTLAAFAFLGMSLRTGVSPQVLAEFYRLWRDDRIALDGDSGAFDYDADAFEAWMRDFRPVSPPIVVRVKYALEALRYHAWAILVTTIVWVAILCYILWKG